jgi:hypothetical protein
VSAVCFRDLATILTTLKTFTTFTIFAIYTFFTTRLPNSPRWGFAAEPLTDSAREALIAMLDELERVPDVTALTKLLGPLPNNQPRSSKFWCKPRVPCMVTWIIRRPINPLLYAYKLRSRTSRSSEQYTQYTPTAYICLSISSLIMNAHFSHVPNTRFRSSFRRWVVSVVIDYIIC